MGADAIAVKGWTVRGVPDPVSCSSSILHSSKKCYVVYIIVIILYHIETLLFIWQEECLRTGGSSKPLNHKSFVEMMSGAK